MENLGLNQIREKYLSFFESKGHLRLPSFPLVPLNDQSLLLINSGMAPLKPFFTGEQIPPRHRVTTCQKCIRTPDIERVGKTARHGTFFEMLGNFSFGDYFKHEATAWAWEFITKVLELPEDRLWVSIYENDTETRDIWVNEVGVNPDHIVKLGKEDNFWEIGVGPCGPCSEIYYDRGEEFGCGSPDCAVGCDCDRFVEFWNLVFTQFNRDENGEYSPLEKKNIDTGMGLERIACIMQGVDNLFEVDTVRNIMNHICSIAGVKYKQDQKTDVSLRVITDHIRSTVMMVSDGVIPSNEGRGYVLRRLLRRAARHGRLIGIDGQFLYKICDTVINENRDAYPALVEKADYIKKIIQAEEERFASTIDSGTVKLNEYISRLKKDGKTVLSGADAFKLSDTYGFPIDLTDEILEENGMSSDREEFDRLMQMQRERARAAREKLGDFAWISEDLGLDKSITTEFCGYDSTETSGKVLAILNAEGRTDSAIGGDVTLVLDRTSFYAESGGQISDTGIIKNDGCELIVKDVRKSPDGKFLHACTFKSGILKVGDSVITVVDRDRRRALMRAHSCTHLLQQALRDVLGSHVEQSGSLVEPDKIRFDFTHFSAMSDSELAQVEKNVNTAILNALDITIRTMPIDQAKQLGATALFGEKYGQIVRVVSMGDYSIELCGGTHASNTSDIGMFKLVSESSVASGVRRIEAVTGMQTLELFNARINTLRAVSSALKTTEQDVLRRAEQLCAEMHRLSRENSSLNQRLAEAEVAKLLSSAAPVGSVKLVTAEFPEMDTDKLRLMSDAAKSADQDIVCVLASVCGEKISFVACCGKQAVKSGANAGALVREIAKLAGGSGGGRPDSATAGGKNPAELKNALGSAQGILLSMLK